MHGSLSGSPPPDEWPQVQHDWFRASTNRDLDGWRHCLADDAQTIGVDGEVVVGRDLVVASMLAYYEGIGPDERIDGWITSTDPGIFVWHGTIEPGTDHESKWCTISTVRDDRISELRFFADRGVLASLWGRHAP